MKRASLLLVLMTLATSAFAQNSELGILIGGSKRSFASKDPVVSDSWKFSNSVREIWYGFHLEPDTVIKIKVGEITAPLGTAGDSTHPADIGKGRIEHLDLLVDYRFDEPFGSTGLFGGAGLYRQMSGPGRNGENSNTDYGFSAGVNGDFPLSRRYGVVIEGAYHWVNYSYKPRFLTLTGGLRIKL